MSANAIHANNPLATGLQGMLNASRNFFESSNALVKDTLTASSSGGSFSSDTVTLSDRVQSTMETATLEQHVVDMQSSAIAYTASAKVVQSSDAMMQTMLNIVV